MIDGSCLEKTSSSVQYSSKFGSCFSFTSKFRNENYARIRLVQNNFTSRTITLFLIYMHVEFGDLTSLNICKNSHCDKIYLVKKKTITISVVQTVERNTLILI